MSGFRGKAIREAREARGLTLAQAYAQTHVPIEYLEALERGDLDKLPTETYALGFLNSYCQFLELDPEPFADQFRLCNRGTKRSRLFKLNPAATDAEPAKPPPAWLAETMTWAAICAILVLGWFTYSVVVRPFAEEPKTRVEAGTQEILPPTHFENPY